MASEVRLAIPPGHGQLRLWGRRGEDWYALVEWLAQTHDYRLHGGDHRGAMFCTGWVIAEHVARLEGQDYSDVPRIELHPDPQHWPTRLRAGVTTTSSDHYFGLLDGGPIAPPAGVRWLVGHGSLYDGPLAGHGLGPEPTARTPTTRRSGATPPGPGTCR